MTNKEAIRVLKSTSINFSRMGGKTAYVEALEMAITALNQLDNNSTKPDNSTATQFNAIKTHVKGLTACRVPEDSLISRQTAIDTLKMDISIIPFAKAREYVRAAIDTIYNRLEELPSVQPKQGDFEKQLHDMFDHIWYCEIDHPVFQDTVGDLMRAVIEAHYRALRSDIVRCRDCEYGKQDEYGRWYCRGLGCQIGDEDGSGFCANAERKSGD